MTFHEALLYHFDQDPHCGRLMQCLQVVADAVKAMHESGFEHGALRNDSITLSMDEQGTWGDVRILGLEQATRHESLSAAQRGRDCGRFDLPSDLLRVFLQMMDAPEILPDAFLAAQQEVRTAFRKAEPSRLPFEPDQWIWDPRSEQAIPTISGKDKRKYYRKADGGQMIRSILPRARNLRAAYKQCMAEAWTQPVAMQDRIGMNIRVDPEHFDRERRWLHELGNIPVLVRLYHHASEEEQRFACEAARKLHAEGHKVSVAFVQDRSAIREPERWARFVETCARAVSGFAEQAEVGHAVNRVKWGVWNFEEYRGLLSAFSNWDERFPQLPLMGPAGIDFEYHRVIPLLDQLPVGMRFQSLSHLLYVDRRGAPENFQGKFDTLRKLALLRAIARVHPNLDDRVVVSEVNWPILGTGVYSPVGSPYVSPGPRHGDPSVDEETYADYMIRYLLMSLCSGMADRVYWWSLAAHGFGLIDDRDPQGWRPRPAFHALKDLLDRVGHGTFVKHVWPEGAERPTYHFDVGGEQVEI